MGAAEDINKAAGDAKDLKGRMANVDDAEVDLMVDKLGKMTFQEVEEMQERIRYLARRNLNRRAFAETMVSIMRTGKDILT